MTDYLKKHLGEALGMFWAAIFMAVVSIVFIAAIIGWISNLTAVLSSYDLMSTQELLVRILGIIIPLIGAVMGWL